MSETRKRNIILIVPAAILLISLPVLIDICGAYTSQSEKPRIYGKVLNDVNQPLADIHITATSLNNDPIRNALATEAITDKDGRYSFTNTISGQNYVLEFRAAGFTYQTERALSGAGKELITTLKREPVHKLTGKVLSYLSGQSAAGSKVILIGENIYRAEVNITQADGSFLFDDVPRNIGQGIIYALKGDFCSEYQIVRAATKELELSLKRPGTIDGEVVSDTGKPVADCVVEVRPEMVSGFSVTQKTKEDGKFSFENLPSGRYRISTTHPKWFMRQTTPNNSAIPGSAINLQSGQTYFSALEMLEKIPVEGRVLGPDDKPAAGAFVGTTSYSGSQGVELTKTEPNGYFKLYTKALNPSQTRGSIVAVELAATADKLGSGRTTVRKSKDNWQQDNSEKNVVIRLNGGMRIFGDVRDSKGNPIHDVRVYLHPNLMPIVSTDASGRYDLNWFALPVKLNESFDVTFRAPRPDDGGVHMGIPLADRKAMQMPKAGTQFYLHQVVSVKAENGREMELNSVLVPTELLTIKGRVTDTNGRPIVQASLMLFAGNAKQDEWLREIDNVRRRSGGGGYGVDSIVFVPLARTVTDKEGNYTLCAVRENAQSLQAVTFTTKIDSNLYSLGVLSLNNVSKLITDIRPQVTQNNMVMDIQLPASQ